MAVTQYQAALLAALDAELASRSPPSSGERPAFDPRPLLTPMQSERYVVPSRFKAVPAGRRSGKTNLLEKVLLTSRERPGQQAFYVSTSIKRAAATIWDEVVRMNQDLSLGGSPNLTTHTMRFPGGGMFTVTGVEDKTMANDLRGRPRVWAWLIDECQDWRDELLKYFYNEVVYYSLADVRGEVWMCGTGGRPDGFWHEVATKSAGWVRFGQWTPFDNPHLAEGEAQALVDKSCVDRGCGIDDPSIQREFFARFLVDTQRQIFPVGEHNWFDARPAGKWTYCIGADFGTVDYAAYVVLGWRPHDPAIYVIESDRQANMGSSAQVELVRAVAARYEGAFLVGDPGGGGASHMVQLRQEHWVPIEAAKKADKAAACITLRDGLRSGRVKLARSEAELGRELGEPEWEPDRVGEVVRGHFPDRVDAMLYAYRRAVALHHATPEKAEPTREQREMDALLEVQARERAMMDDLGLQ